MPAKSSPLVANMSDLFDSGDFLAANCSGLEFTVAVAAVREGFTPSCSEQDWGSALIKCGYGTDPDLAFFLITDLDPDPNVDPDPVPYPMF
jgi:hypothetical protein